jgi:uncharacterized protein (TIGR02246 family)
MNADEEVAIKQVIENWEKGWREVDAQLASQDYAEDADWTNAFGVMKKRRAQIREFLTHIFDIHPIRSMRISPSTVRIRSIRPGVAVVSSYTEVTGQKTASGNEYPTRRIHQLRVLIEEQGKWLIVSHLIMDEKEPLP